MSNTKWKTINQAGSGCKPESTDTPVREDAQQAVDRANRASDLHRQANEAADRSSK
jgi:hypothetical protein